MTLVKISTIKHAFSNNWKFRNKLCDQAYKLGVCTEQISLIDRCTRTAYFCMCSTAQHIPMLFSIYGFIPLLKSRSLVNGSHSLQLLEEERL